MTARVRAARPAGGRPREESTTRRAPRCVKPPTSATSTVGTPSPSPRSAHQHQARASARTGSSPPSSRGSRRRPRRRPRERADRPLLTEGVPRGSRQDAVDAQLTTAKAPRRPRSGGLSAGSLAPGDVTVLSKQTLVRFGTSRQFAMLQPSTPQRFDVGLTVPRRPGVRAPRGRRSWNTRVTHRVPPPTTSVGDLDSELTGRIRRVSVATGA